MGKPFERRTPQGMAVLELLTLAPEDEHYGLGLARAARMNVSSVYPVLARLEDAGWVSSRTENIDPSTEGRRARRLYKLTGYGARAAAEELESWRRELLRRDGPVGIPSLRGVTA